MIIKNLMKALLALLFVGFISLIIITGISGKYRNVIALSIPFYFIISYFLTYIKSVNIKRVYLFSALILSVISVFNLITHQDTTKNSYNLPISKLTAFLKNSKLLGFIWQYTQNILSLGKKLEK